MEPQKTLPPSHRSWSPLRTDSPQSIFGKAAGFTKEYYRETVDRISNTALPNVSPEFFFDEYTWVVHATGFSSHAVTKFMPALRSAWGPVLLIPSDLGQVLPGVLKVCNNPVKARSIHKTAMIIQAAVSGGEWENWKRDYLSTPEALSNLPYIGKITSMHLARNLGNLQVVKPDLHLVRMAQHFGYKDAFVMVAEMSKQESLEPGIADLCLWYYLSTFGSVDYRQEGER